MAVISRFQLTRAGLTMLLSNDPGRARVIDVSSHDGHLGSHDVAVYDLAGLIDSSENDLRHLIATQKPVVGLVPGGRPDLGDGALAAGVAQLVAMDVTGSVLLQVLEKAVADGFPAVERRRERRRLALMTEFGLTARELEILVRIGAGVSNVQIADELYLSINSVKTYIRSAYKRIGVTTRAQAVLWVVRNGAHR